MFAQTLAEYFGFIAGRKDAIRKNIHLPELLGYPGRINVPGLRKAGIFMA